MTALSAMIEDELVKIWQSSPNQERVKFEKSRLMIDVQSGLDRLHRFVKYRDLMDTIPAIMFNPVICILCFHRSLRAVKNSFRTHSRLVYIRHFPVAKSEKNKPNSMTGTYLEYLIKNRQFLMDQKELMETVLYWAVIPMITLVSLFFVGVFMGRPGPPIKRAIALSGNVILGIVVYLMNKWAVKKQIMPRLVKVDALIKVMEKE